MCSHFSEINIIWIAKLKKKKFCFCAHSKNKNIKVFDGFTLKIIEITASV